MALSKLDQLVESEGYDSVEALCEAVLMDAVSPGICMNLGCSYTAEVEPDQHRGHCEACGTRTVKSALLLAGLI
jgi:hypothetical protein